MQTFMEKYIKTKEYLKQYTMTRKTEDMITELSLNLGKEFVVINGGITLREVVKRAFIEGAEFSEKTSKK